MMTAKNGIFLLKCIVMFAFIKCSAAAKPQPQQNPKLKSYCNGYFCLKKRLYGFSLQTFVFNLSTTMAAFSN
jgi:predicted nucleic acid binding AN1-type Zn finger protein